FERWGVVDESCLPRCERPNLLSDSVAQSLRERAPDTRRNTVERVTDAHAPRHGPRLPYDMGSYKQ
ncbi:MAG: hypothetical protein ACRD6W_07125, partial [Nitrososphaerales archaeon]